jgi:hypothetical protein
MCGPRGVGGRHIRAVLYIGFLAASDQTKDQVKDQVQDSVRID